MILRKEINEKSSFKKRYKDKNFNPKTKIRFGVSALKETIKAPKTQFSGFHQSAPSVQPKLQP